jgi:hypothetical protein
VRTGSSYLSQSELPVTFGLGRRDRVDEAIVEWPGGGRDTIGALRAGRAYVVTEGKGVTSERALRSQPSVP